MSPTSSKRKTKLQPRKRSVDDIKACVRPIVIGSLWAFFHLYLILATTSTLNSFLSPVYGSIPSSRYHQSFNVVALLVSSSTYHLWKGSSQAWSQGLSLLQLLVPSIQLYLFRYSRLLGASTGPLISGLATSFPLAMIGAVVANKRLAPKIDDLVFLDGVKYQEAWIGMMPQIFTMLVSLVVYKANVSFMTFLTHTFFARFSRLGLYYLFAVPQALVSPSKYLLFALIPMMHSILFSVYIPLPYGTTHLNRTLQDHGYSLVARQESCTGYISVLDNHKDGYRVMRCDHSLLGGEWFPPPGRETQLREPVYAIFVMLEAVRLVQPDSGSQVDVHRQKSALVIGLGIGTTPSALIAHGIDTTVVEIDPTVHDFATRYFRLPANHTAIIEDAVVFVHRSRNKITYDYIIHDVFTGGAEPIDLFTLEFLTGLKDMLSKKGVIAINYAGDLRLQTASMVIRTVLTVFPTCRLFREDAGPSTAKAEKPTLSTDFTNLVMFCQKAPGSFHFRRPTTADFLGSQARRYHLLPQHEVDPKSFIHRHGRDVVRKKDLHILAEAQMRSAVGHWSVMRGVLPDAVWENW